MKKDIEKDFLLIQKILQGDKKAADEFYSKYLIIVKNFLKSKFTMLDDETINDCTSDIIFKLHLNLDKYSFNKASVKTWVLAIAKHYMIDMNRQYQSCITFTAGNTITLTSGGEDTVYMSNSSYSTDEVQLTGMVSYSVSNSIDFENCNAINYISTQIDSVDYQYLDMKYKQGYNYSEIGTEFNLSSNTISNRVNYLKSKLKKNNKEEVVL